MSEFAWESEAVEAAEPQQPHKPVTEPESLALSADDFSALEERVLRAVNLVRRERQVRTEAEQRAAKAEAQLHEQSPMVEQLQKEITALRAERDHVRQRVDRLLAQLDALEL